MKKVCVLFGLLPFLIGGVMNQVMTRLLESYALPMDLIALTFLAGWGILAFFLARRLEEVGAVVLRLNLVGAAVLILIGIQELVLGAYWGNFVGRWTQFYYLPVISLGSRLAFWSHVLFGAYCGAFILMALSSAIGAALARK